MARTQTQNAVIGQSRTYKYMYVVAEHNMFFIEPPRFRPLLSLGYRQYLAKKNRATLKAEERPGTRPGRPLGPWALAHWAHGPWPIGPMGPGQWVLTPSISL